MPKRPKFVNPFEIPGRWYKANLHTHTTNSDGHLHPLDRVRQYRKAGYQVLALTDHGVINDVRGMSDGKILVVSGMEYHPKCPTHHHAYHLVALRVKPGFKFKGLTANGFIRKVTRAGGAVSLAHPYWCGYQLENFRNLKGLAAIEVFNATCGRGGRDCSESEWAHALDHGMPLPAVAVDDVHSADGHDLFHGWTWLKMTAPTAANVVRAVRTGACYASCGPKIHDFRVIGETVGVRCSPVVRIDIISSPPYGALKLADPGKTITSLVAPVGRDWSGNRLPFVRARVTDREGRRAWTNPVYL